MENLLPVLISVFGYIGRAYSAWRVTLRGADAEIADLRERLQATEEVLAIVTGRLEKMAPHLEIQQPHAEVFKKTEHRGENALSGTCWGAGVSPRYDA